MPLWSNEDWRARIGSCWCAFGRTFNTRFTRCRGKSQRDLSTHQAATMVIMMILFIAANMGLYVTRERHKNLICGVLFGESITELHLFRFGLLLSFVVPVLKIVVRMVCGRLPMKLKKSLKQFFIDLNDGLWFIGSVIRTFIVSPVLFVVNFMTGNISNVLGKLSNRLTKPIGDRLLNGILMRSLVAVIVVTIQLLVLVVVARAIILQISGDVQRNRGPGHIDYFITEELLLKAGTTAVQASLLLRCGDVESNPGPLTREDIQKVDNSTLLTEDHLRDVFREVVTIKSTYYQLGLELGLSPGELDPMRMTSTYNVDQALNDMLLVWLRQRYNTGVHRAPTWQRLVEAVNSLSGGNNPSLAISIANKHLVTGVAPIVNIPHGQYNYQGPHPSSSFMLPPPPHMPMHIQPSLSPHLHNQGVAPTVNIPHGQHNYQSPHPSSSFMLPPPGHIPTYNQPAFSQHLSNQGVSPVVNIPHGQHSFQSPHPSSSFVHHPGPVHMLMHNQPSFSPQLHNQDYPERIPNFRPPRRGNFAHLPPNMTSSIYTYAQAQPHYVQGVLPIQVLPSLWNPQPELSEDGGFESVPQPGRHPSQVLLGQVRLSAHDLQYIDRQKFVDSYLAQEHSTDAWPPLKIVDFVKLSLVKQDKHVYHMNLRTIEKDIDSVVGGKSNIRYEDIFQTVDNMSLVLFEGRPGSGKTTLLVRISCDWARGAFLSSKLVLLVRLRHLNKTEDTCLHDILSVACPDFFTFGDCQCLSSYIERILGENVVFLLDGFDEYAPGAHNDNYISKLILKKVCPRSIVILSSRPAATQRFRQNASIYIEVVGFMKEQVLRYVNCYFEDDKEKSLFLVKHLEKHQNLMNLCYLPLHCAMLVFLYEVDDILPETETEFYRDFTLSLLIRSIRKHTDMPPNLESFDCLPDAEKDIFHKICKLAFKATVDSRQVFKEREVKEIFFNDNSTERVGLVVIDRYFAKCGIDETYTFLHLTLQEYLAAVFVSRLSESKQISAIANHFSRQHLFVTTRFLFGILDYCKENTKNLFEQMLGATKDHHLHHIQCACESHSASACTDVINFHDKNLSFQNVNNSSDIFCITFVLKTGEYDAIELSFSKCDFDVNDAVSLLQGVGDRQLSLTMKLDHCHCHVTSVAEVLGEGLQHMTKAHHTTDRTLKITLKNCDFNKEAAVGVLQAVGDCRLSLTITYEYMIAQPLVDALCLVTLPGLIELNVGDDNDNLTMRPNNLKHSTNLQNVTDFVEDDDDICPTMGPNNLKHSTDLQKLNLIRLDVSNSELDKALKHWPNLVELKLDNCRCHVTSVAEVLGDGLQHMTEAHHTTDRTLEITLKNCDFNKEAAVGLLQAVGDRRLSLTISHQDMLQNTQSLVDALCLVALPGLIELNLDWCKIDASTAVVLGESLQHTSKLQTLELRRTDISNGLVEGFKHLPNLLELNLGGCKIDASTAVVLGESLQHTSKLQTLRLGGNPIGDDGLHALSLPIKNYCKELKELWLLGTQLTDRSITCLTEWIKVLNNLEKLNLDVNHFSEGGVKQIEEAVSERNTREGVAKLELYISFQTPLS